MFVFLEDLCILFSEIEYLTESEAPGSRKGHKSLSSRDLHVSTCPVLELQIQTNEKVFDYIWRGNPKSGLHVCVINTSPTKLASQIPYVFF